MTAKNSKTPDVLSLPDGGPDPKRPGKRKQKAYTLERGLRLHVLGDSRLYYSPWEMPKDRLKDGQRRAPKLHPLGSAHRMSFDKALAAHIAFQDGIKDGKYPDAPKAGPGRKSNGPTFESYATVRVAGWAKQRKNDKDAAGMINIVPMYCGPINRLGMRQIETTDVLKIFELDDFWNEKPTMAEEVRALVSRVLKAAGREGLRVNDLGAIAKRDVILDVLGNQAKSKRGGKYKALDYDEMPAFMPELRDIGSQSARALETLILTNLRSRAVRFMCKSWLVLDGPKLADKKRPGPRLVVPWDMMKIDDDEQPFIVPLVPRAVEVIKQQIAYLEDLYGGQQEVDLLWPGTDLNTNEPTHDRPISENTMRDLMQDTLKREATPHGCRATFDTWALNQLHPDGISKRFNEDAKEYCMAHNPGDKVTRAYRRDQLWQPRVSIMNEWARHCAPPKAKLKAVA